MLLCLSLEEPIPTPPINPREPEYFRKPVFGAVLLEIRDLLYPHWFELFQAVGLDRKVLVDINERYRKDPKVCMVEGIRLWLEQEPLPCWDDMVDQIRQCLLEVELSDRIEKTLQVSLGSLSVFYGFCAITEFLLNCRLWYRELHC